MLAVLCVTLSVVVLFLYPRFDRATGCTRRVGIGIYVSLLLVKMALICVTLLEAKNVRLAVRRAHCMAEFLTSCHAQCVVAHLAPQDAPMVSVTDYVGRRWDSLATWLSWPGYACFAALQVAARSGEPDRAGRVRREQYLLLALAVLSALASFAVNLVGARRLCSAVAITTRRISESVARISAAGGSSPGARRNGRGARVAPGLHNASAALKAASAPLNEAPRSTYDGPWHGALVKT